MKEGDSHESSHTVFTAEDSKGSGTASLQAMVDSICIEPCIVFGVPNSDVGDFGVLSKINAQDVEPDTFRSEHAME